MDRVIDGVQNGIVELLLLVVTGVLTWLIATVRAYLVSKGVREEVLAQLKTEAIDREALTTGLRNAANRIIDQVQTAETVQDYDKAIKNGLDHLRKGLPQTLDRIVPDTEHLEGLLTATINEMVRSAQAAVQTKIEATVPGAVQQTGTITNSPVEGNVVIEPEAGTELPSNHYR